MNNLDNWEAAVVTFNLGHPIFDFFAADEHVALRNKFADEAVQCVEEELEDSCFLFQARYAANTLSVVVKLPSDQLSVVLSLLNAARDKIELRMRAVMLCYVGIDDFRDTIATFSISSIRASCDPLPVDSRSECFVGLFDSVNQHDLSSTEDAISQYGSVPDIQERSKRKRHLLKLYMECFELSSRVGWSLRTDSVDDMNIFSGFVRELLDVFRPRQAVNFKYTWRQHQKKTLAAHLQELQRRKNITDEYWQTNLSSFSLTDSSGDRHDLIAEPDLLLELNHERFPVVVEFDVGDIVVKPFAGCVYGRLQTEWLGIVADFAVGKEFVWADFVSMTTLEERVVGAKIPGVSYEIRCCSCIDEVIERFAPAKVSHLSQLWNETEILFPPNVRFRVHNIRNLDRSIVHFDAGKPVRIQFETTESPSLWDILKAKDWHLFDKWADAHADWMNTAGSTRSIINTVVDVVVDLLKNDSDDIDIDDSKHALQTCLNKGASIDEKDFQSGDAPLDKIAKALRDQPRNMALQRVMAFVREQMARGDLIEALVADCDQDLDLEDGDARGVSQSLYPKLHCDSVSEVQTSPTSGSRSRSRLPAPPWLQPTVHAPLKPLKSTTRNPLRIPEPLGLVEPSWLPYTQPTTTQSEEPKQMSKKMESKQLHRKRCRQWNSRHIVCGSKDNRCLPRLRRTYFDDMPFSRCQNGEYQAVPSHRARNFDHFCLSQGRDQLRELRQRFQQYPFVEVLKESTENLHLQHQHQVSAFGCESRSTSSTSSGSFSSTDTPENEKAEACAAPESPDRLHGLRRFSLGRRNSDSSGFGRRNSGTSSDEFWTSPQQLKPKRPLKTKMGHYSIFAKGILPQFHSWCGAKFGSLVQCWRCLDVHNHMRIGQGQFLRGLLDLGYSGDARELFKELNRDQTGTLLFYHFAPEAALAIGELLHWARTQFGSLGDVGISRLLDKRAHITRAQFLQFCKKKGFQNEVALHVAYDLMDKDGTEMVTKTEIGLLDHWDFPEWLTAQPDEAAAETCKEKLVAHCHDNALLAWRHLDRHNTMRVAWHDFRQVCRKMLSAEDCQCLASAWRALDDDLSGWLSLREFDRATYDQLVKFVKWAEESFHGIHGAFPKLHGHKDAQISAYDFRHTCRPSGLGDAVISKIFMGLDLDGTGSVTSQEIRFLSSWKVSADALEEEAWGSLTRAATGPVAPKRKAARLKAIDA